MEMSPTTSPPAPETRPPAHGPVEEFTRLAGHVRLISASAVLLMRIGMLIVLLFTWPAIAEPAWDHTLRAEQLVPAMVLAAITVWCAQFLLVPWYRKPIVTGLLATAGAFCWMVLAALLFWREPLAARFAHIGTLASLILAGGVLGIVASRYARLFLQQTNAETAGAFAALATSSTRPATRFCLQCAAAVSDGAVCAACGKEMPISDTRPAVERELSRMQHVWEASLLSLRCLALLLGLFVLTGLAAVWADQSRGTVARVELEAIILWVFWGVLAGSGVGFLAVHRRRWQAVLGAAVIVAVGFVAGLLGSIVTTHDSAALRVPLLFWQLCVAGIVAAALSCTITHWLVGAVVTHFVPLPAAQVMLGRKIERQARANAAALPGALACENCGYQLEGLPASRCQQCKVVSLRCPECGHVQPANTLHARALRQWHRLHIAIRVMSWLVGLGIVGLLSFPWVAIVAAGGSRIFERMDWEKAMGFLLGAFVLLGPIRLVLLHGRRAWLFSLLVGLLPMAIVLVPTLSLFPERSGRLAGALAVTLLPICLIVSFTTPLLWRLWLWCMYRSPLGGEMYAWHRSPAYRHKTYEQVIADPDGALGREMVLQCSPCGQSLSGQRAQACAECGVHWVGCNTCGAQHGISAVRIGMETMRRRARFMALALLAAMAAGAGVILICADFINGSSMLSWIRYSYSMDGLINTIESAGICAVLVGIFGRWVTIRRRNTVMMAAVVALVHVLWFAIAPLPFMSDYGVQASRVDMLYLSVAIAIGSGLLAFAAALAAGPLLRLACMMLPASIRWPLHQWLIGELTLDDAPKRIEA